MSKLINDVFKSNFLRLSKNEKYSYNNLSKRIYSECKFVILPFILLNLLMIILSISCDLVFNITGLNYWIATFIRLGISLIAIIYYQIYKDHLIGIVELLFLVGTSFSPITIIPLSLYIMYKCFVIEILYD